MFYPLMIDIENKEISIVGGGKVGIRKAKKFLEYGAYVKVISLEFFHEFIELEKTNSKLILVKSDFKEELIRKSFLVVASTSIESLNNRVSMYCKEHNILCNVVDSVESSDFIVPSTIKRGDLTIGVSTLGNSPSLCAKIRKDLESMYGKDYEEYVILLGECRKLILDKYKDEKEKKELLNSLVNLSLMELKEFRANLLK